jgi:hypothetical protein
MKVFLIEDLGFGLLSFRPRKKAARPGLTGSGGYSRLNHEIVLIEDLGMCDPFNFYRSGYGRKRHDQFYCKIFSHLLFLLLI